jgi:hypothetical protein
VSDQGFDFQQDPPRREVRHFEPPPWEKELFEQHERERAEAEAERQRQEAADQAAEALGATLSADETPSAALPEPKTEPTKGEIDQREVELMLAGLRAEDPDPLARAWLVSVVAGVVLALIGLSVAVWGTVALARHPAGAGGFGGMVLVVFGLGFAGLGGWLVFKGLRQQGVL